MTWKGSRPDSPEAETAVHRFLREFYDEFGRYPTQDELDRAVEVSGLAEEKPGLRIVLDDFLPGSAASQPRGRA